MKLSERIESLASDMGFDGPEAVENLLEFITGQGLVLVLASTEASPCGLATGAWRTGTKNPHALYENDRPMGFIADADAAKRIVNAMNRSEGPNDRDSVLG